MRLTIIPVDSAVYKDQVIRYPDLSVCGIPQEVHALQWYGSSGEIEFISVPGQPKPTNENIDSLPQWALDCVSAWDNWVDPMQESIQPAPNQPTVEGAQTL